VADVFLEDYASTLEDAAGKLADISKQVVSKPEVDFNKQKVKRALKQLNVVLGLLKSNFRVAGERTKMVTSNIRVASELRKIAKLLTAGLTGAALKPIVDRLGFARPFVESSLLKILEYYGVTSDKVAQMVLDDRSVKVVLGRMTNSAEDEAYSLAVEKYGQDELESMPKKDFDKALIEALAVVYKARGNDPLQFTRWKSKFDRAIPPLVEMVQDTAPGTGQLQYVGEIFSRSRMTEDGPTGGGLMHSYALTPPGYYMAIKKAILRMKRALDNKKFGYAHISVVPKSRKYGVPVLEVSAGLGEKKSDDTKMMKDLLKFLSSKFKLEFK